MERFPLTEVVVELLSEAEDGRCTLRPGAEGVLRSALDALHASGADLKPVIDDVLRLLFVLLEERKSALAVRTLVELIIARPEVREALKDRGDLERAVRLFRERFEGTASSAKPSEAPPPGTKRSRHFKSRFKV